MSGQSPPLKCLAGCGIVCCFMLARVLLMFRLSGVGRRVSNVWWLVCAVGWVRITHVWSIPAFQTVGWVRCCVLLCVVNVLLMFWFSGVGPWLQDVGGWLVCCSCSFSALGEPPLCSVLHVSV